MKKTTKYFVLLGLLTGSFVFGISSGYYKHFPFYLLSNLKNSIEKTGIEFVPNPPSPFLLRTHNTLGLTSKEIEISDNTGIYLTYGQSNSANSGELGYLVQNKVYQFILGNTFDYKDPSLGGTGNGGSVWGMVGDKLIKKGFHDIVIFSNSGVSGRRIDELNKGGEFDFLIFNYNTLIQKYGRVDGILFHQGESNNSSLGIKNYYNDFSEFMINLKEKGIEIPVFLSRASLCGKRLPINKNLTDIQNQLINDFDLIKEGPNTDLLSLKLDRLEDYCHFSLKGNDKFSDMWVDSIIKNKK